MDWLVYILSVVLRLTVSIFPLKFAQFRAKVWGKFFYYVMPIRKKVALKNIQLCFPELTKSEMNKIVKEAYVNILTVIFEFLYFPKLKIERIKKLINITNPELITNKLKEGKGLILISSHFGNWELTAYGVSQIVNEPFHVITKEQTNSLIDKKINWIRELHGNKMIVMKDAPREIIKLLRENKIVAMLGDQSAPADSIAKVKFFADNVPMFEGPARFAIKLGAPMLFGVSFRNNDGTYRLTLKEIDVNKYKEYNEANVRLLTQDHASLLENAIKESPGHWLWFHRKFKSIIKYN